MIRTNNETYSIFKKIPLVLPQRLSRQINSQIDVQKSYFQSIKKKLREEIAEKDLYKRLSNTNALCLELSRQCTNRCGYCVYSGIYKSRRIHQDKKMPYATALKALDLFFRQLTSPYRTMRKTPILSVYGGEPLLEFDTMVKVVRYARGLSHLFNQDIDFLLTTNGVLLKKDALKFLVEENFVIDISLDGPRQEHDRFRLKSNGSGSFDDIFNNIRYIKKIILNI